MRDNYVTYSAYPGEKPVISGAVPVTNWKKEKETWVAAFNHGEVPVLLANGKKQTLARVPNAGYFTLRTTPASSLEIPYRAGDIQSWSGMEGNRIVILLRWRTADNVIDRIDEQKQIAFLQKPEDGPGGNNGLLVVPPRYYIENVKALMDAPGEWFFDKSNRNLSYLPARGISDPNRAALSVPRLNQLVQVRGDEDKPVRNLRLYGLIWEGAKENFRDFPHHYEPTPGCVAVNWEYALDCEFANSELRACGGVGMAVGLGCFNLRIFGNTFEGLEQGAMSVSGTSDLKNGKLIQITRETLIDHNVFSECGLGGGITLAVGGAIHTRISHNYFTKSGRPYTINCGGGGLEGNVNGDCMVEYNHFEDVQHDADDAGVIVVNGMTFNSVVRHNLIHGVHRGFFSDNVAFWFDNMSSHWTVTNNIYYDLEQGEMKTCGTYLIDNDYAANFAIEPPQRAPERFIEGAPELNCTNLRMTLGGKPIAGEIATGSIIKVRAEVANTGSSGAGPIALYVDRRAVETKAFPVIRQNTRPVEFELRLNDPGRHAVGIGETEPQFIAVRGAKPAIVFDRIELSEESILAGEPVQITALAINLQSNRVESAVSLYGGGTGAKTSVNSVAGRGVKVGFLRPNTRGGQFSAADWKQRGGDVKSDEISGA
ncbi:MAG: right-handed parallel beta-helix repeat-containing protein [Verrucomicrobiota bacterium]